jgi:tetratricopeptide (TPR) repeat protein
LNLRESREGSTAFTLLPILNGFALLQRDIGDYSTSRQLVERAASIAELYRDRESVDAADSFGTLGQILELQGNLADAKAWLARALMIRERCFGPESATVVGTLSDLALTARHQGRLRESEDLYRRILRVAASPDALLNLGRVLFEQRRTKEAEKVFRQAIARAGAPPHPALAEGLTSLAMLLIAQHQYKEAESLLRHASEIDGHNFAADDPKIAADLSNRAALAVARKRYAEAEELLAHADAILTKRLPADHPEIGKVMASLAEIRSRQLRWEESEELYERAVKILEQAWGSENPQLLSTLESYSRVLRARQDYAAAERMDLRTTKIRVVQTLRASD